MAWLTFLLVSILWGLVGGLAPFLVPSGPQKVRNIISNLLKNFRTSLVHFLGIFNFTIRQSFCEVVNFEIIIKKIVNSVN